MELFGSLTELKESRRRIKRRRFLGFLAAGGAGLIGFRWYLRRPQRLANRKIAFVTQNDTFYTVAKTMSFSPEIAPNEWRLELKGLNGARVELSYDALKAMPSKTILKTFECIGNPVGGDAIGNAEWKAVSLPSLLKDMLPRNRDKLRVVFYALDDFFSSVPLDLALSEQSYIAYEMNGVPLPKGHGFPARAILPSLYGMKQPKWLKRIEITDEPVSGFWEQQGWSSDASVKTMSRIDIVEKVSPTQSRDHLIAGIAYAGGKAVNQVQVSLDNGANWQGAELTTRPQPNVWSLWQYLWREPSLGEYTLACRAIDESGQRQIESGAFLFPSGATGVHRVKFIVS